MKYAGRYAFAAASVASALMLSGFFGIGKNNSSSLDPDHPVSLTVWHYYNGAQQQAFDELVSEFNAGEGKELGIYVEGYSQGSVADLEQALSDSVAGKVGSDPLPDLFSTYSDTAFAIQKEGLLADLKNYFTDEELSAYVDRYIEEGYFTNDGSLYLFPVAKSTEIMMVNTTDWEPFAAETGCTFEDLKTIEGVIEVAEKYYDWTDAQTPDVEGDGKAFYGRDSMSNYFIIGMKQLGEEIFSVENGEVTINTDKDKIRRLWDNYYVPYMKGYMGAFGKFRSDDVKTGDLLAYTGSSSSAMYFPDAVMTDDDIRDIDFTILPAPVFEGAETCNVQQGAGMAVTKSDEAHEYASACFLKWFTRKENNLRFVCESAYLPVTKEANSAEALDQIIKDQDLTVSKKAYDCLTFLMNDFENMQMYSTKCFDNGFATRTVLDYNLSDQAKADKEAVDAAVLSGEDREEATAPYLTDEAFESWYEQLNAALAEKAGK